MAATVVAPLRAAGGGEREVAGAALGDVVAGGDRVERGVVEPDAHGCRRAARSWPARRPRARTASSSSRAIRALSGRGRPWAMIVDSSATTGAARGQRLGDLGRDARSRAALRGLTISGRSTRV